MIISILNTGKRIARMQRHAGLQDQISPGVGLLLFLIARLDMPYMQEHLNRIWKRYLEAQARSPSCRRRARWPCRRARPRSAAARQVPPGQLPPQQPGGFTE